MLAAGGAGGGGVGRRLRVSCLFTGKWAKLWRQPNARRPLTTQRPPALFPPRSNTENMQIIDIYKKELC